MNKLIIMLLSSILLLFSKAGLTEETVKDVDDFVFPVGYEDSSGIEVAAKDLSEHIASHGSNHDLNREYHFNEGLPQDAGNERYGMNNNNEWYNYSDVGNYYSPYNGLHPGEDWNLGSGNEDLGKSVFAIANGQVIFREDWTSKGLGFCYVIKHKINKDTTIVPYAGGAFAKQPDYIYSKYLHVTGDLESNAVVTKGQKIFTIAKLSNMSSHLHFEIQEKNNGCSYPNAEQANGYYKTDYDGATSYEEETKRVFELMKKDGILDPSDFINANKDIKACAPSNPSTATVTSVTVSRDQYGTNFSKENNIFQLKSLGDNTKYIFTLEGTGFSDDSNCPSPITIDWELTPSNGQPVKKGKKDPYSKTESKAIFSFNEGSGADRLGNWKFTVKKGDQLIPIEKGDHISAVSTMDDNASTLNCFPDISALDTEKKKAICYLKDEGILNGYSDGTVKLNNPINRAEFVTIIMRFKLGENNVNGACNDASDKPFSDVEKYQWYCKAVKEAKEGGYINGYSDGTFKPVSSINNKEAAKVIFTSVLGVTHADNLWNDTEAPSYENCATRLWKVSGFSDYAIRGDVFFWLYKAIELKNKATAGQTFNMQTCAFN